MTSPAQRHMMRVSAAMTAQREAAPLRHATVYEQMLVKLAADQRTLKAIYSKELKAAKKRELLPFWLPWVNGVLEQGKGAQDDILMTVMLWRLDTGDIAGALEIARYALKYGLTMPGKHRRTPPYMFTEEVALAAMRAHAAGESVDTVNRKLPPVLRVWRTSLRTTSTVKASKFFTTSAPCVRWRPRRFMSVTAAWMPVRKATRRPTALTAPLMSCGGICAGRWRVSRTSRAAS